MSVVPVQAVGAPTALEPLFGASGAAAAATPAGGASFAEILFGGIDKVSQKLVEADAQAKAFALDDSIPLHQVTFALEEGRMALELMIQVRTRLVEAYQQIMQMQL